MTNLIIPSWLCDDDKYKSNVIYMLIFPNWKYYIGQTSLKLIKRIYQHTHQRSPSATKKERAIEKYKHFHVLVLEECETQDELNKQEENWIKTFNTFEQGYNSTTGGCTIQFSSESLKKMSEASKGKTISSDHKKRISESNKHRIVSEATKEKLSEINKGKSIPYETRQKISESLKGKKTSDETKKKLSEVSKGKIVSDETRIKMSESRKGKKASDETKKKQSEYNKSLPQSTWDKLHDSVKQKCKSIPDNIEFNSITECIEYYSKIHGSFCMRPYMDTGKTHKKSGQKFIRI